MLPVVSPNEFWLQLHRLAVAYDAEGLTAQERAENIVEQLRDMPHIARRAVLADLLQVAVNIPDLYPLATAAANETDAPIKRVSKEGAA